MNPKWKWRSKEAAEREHDEKTPNEHDAAQQLMEVATTTLVMAYTRWMMAEHRVSSVHSQWIVHLITLYSMDSDGQRLRGDDDWNLKNTKASGLCFVMTPNQYRFIGDIVGIHDFQWVLESHIAAESDCGAHFGGHRLRSRRLQDVFYAVNVSMVTMPSVIYRVVMSYRIHCVETGSTVTVLLVVYEEGGVG